MIFCDYHVHTDFCDGSDSPQRVAEAAYSMGLKELGFSVHSYTFFDESYCIKKEQIVDYKRQIEELKSEYRGRMKILCGTELDCYSDMDISGFDYVIGSVHYVKSGSEYIPIDESKELLLRAADEFFGGDIMSLCEAYYRAVARLSDMPRLDIIGHFDLITKFNEGEALFSESDKRYVSASRAAADALLPLGVPFEINTGAISRGYRSVSYPSSAILEYISKKSGSAILSSDSHSSGGLCFGFDLGAAKARANRVRLLEKLNLKP